MKVMVQILPLQSHRRRHNVIQSSWPSNESQCADMLPQRHKPHITNWDQMRQELIATKARFACLPLVTTGSQDGSEALECLRHKRNFCCTSK